MVVSNANLQGVRLVVRSIPTTKSVGRVSMYPVCDITSGLVKEDGRWVQGSCSEFSGKMCNKDCYQRGRNIWFNRVGKRYIVSHDLTVA